MVLNSNKINDPLSITVAHLGAYQYSPGGEPTCPQVDEKQKSACPRVVEL